MHRQVFEVVLFAGASATFAWLGFVNLALCIFAWRVLPDLRGLALEAPKYDVLEPSVVGAREESL